MNIVIAGGTGFIGSRLVQALANEQHTVTLLSRRPASAGRTVPPGVIVEAWDGTTTGRWTPALEHADALVNLAGEPIAGGRWTRVRKQRIIDSRIDATRALVAALRARARKPAVFVNASAVGFYGSVPEGGVSEHHRRGEGFLPVTCEQWEHEARTAEELGVRVIRLRIGIVLGDGGGALSRMLLPFRLFSGGWPGSGLQWFPWVHRDDLIRAIIFALGTEPLHGAVNIASPGIVRMKEFAQVVGKVLRRPAWVPVPAPLLRLAMGEMADMVLTGQKAIPEKLLRHGFRFTYPDLEPALRTLLP